MWYICELLVIMLVVAKSRENPQNNTVLISTYAKVAHWGPSYSSNATSSTALPKEEARSSGQTLWTHRSDANVVSGQNLKNKKPSIIYSYSMNKASSKADQRDAGPSNPQIQERFNPRPYFDYDKVSMKNGDSSSKSQPSPVFDGASDSQPSITYGSPFDSFPVFKKPDDSKPPDTDDIYNSPYTSYNPPAKDDSKDDDNTNYNFPPLAAPPSNSYKNTGDFSNAQSADDDSNDKPPGGSYEMMRPPNSYLPPVGPPPSHQHNDAPPSSNDNSYSNYEPPMDDSKPPSAMGPPPQKSKFPGPYADIPSYASDDHHMMKPTAPGPGPGYGPPQYHGGHDEPMGPPITQTIGPPHDSHSAYYGHGPPDFDHDHSQYQQPPSAPAAPPSMPDDDMSMPPPKAPHGTYGQLPQYLDHDPKDHGYDFYGYDHHHVYHEVTTTTTTEAPEDERVNKGHYSYFYLGRKLWYIPLYFSIYFIIYVTVLILKSIARHKVDFKHNFHDKHRKSRNMDVNQIHGNVNSAIDAANQKYEFM